MKTALAILTLGFLATIAGGDTFALLVNGGHTWDTNFNTFSDDIRNMRETLLAKGVPAENIYVLDGNGPTNIIQPWSDTNPPQMDLMFGDSIVYYKHWYGGYYGQMSRVRVQSPDDWDGDGDNDEINGPATLDGLQDAVSYLAPRIRWQSDDLIVQLVDHGGINDGGDFEFGMWDQIRTGQEIVDTIYGLDAIQARQTAWLVSTCHAGGFAEVIKDQKMSFGLFQSPIDDVGWSKDGHYALGGPESGWHSGLYDDEGNPIIWGAAVVDGIAGGGTWAEVFQYALEHDQFGPINNAFDGEYIEHPELFDLYGVAAAWHLPEPGTLMLLVAGAGFLCLLRRR